MHISFTNFSSLMSDLSDVSFIADDAMSAEDMKNIIFRLKSEPKSAELIGFNNLITFKRSVPQENFELGIEDSEKNQNGEFIFQLKCKELLGFLNSYKSVRKTVVDEVIFETTPAGTIKCTVIEIEKDEKSAPAEESMFMFDEEDSVPKELKKLTSQWIFNTAPIRPAILENKINLKSPDGDLETIPTQYISFHSKNLLPIMENTTNVTGYMMFDNEYTLAFTNTFIAVMVNILGNTTVFKGIKLSYRAISFLDKIICSESSVGVARTEQYIYVKTDTSEAFIIYDTKLAKYQDYLNMFVRDNAVTIDRIYFKDVIKRLSLLQDAVEVNIDVTNKNIVLTNSHFQQTVPINRTKGLEGYNNIKFKVMPVTLDKAIIGSDEDFTQDLPDELAASGTRENKELFVYTCINSENPSQSGIVFSDASGGWFSILRVKVY